MNNSLAWKYIIHTPSFIHTNQTQDPNSRSTVNITIASLCVFHCDKYVCKFIFISACLQKLSWERDKKGSNKWGRKGKGDLRGWHEQQLVGSLSSLTPICYTDMNSPLPFTKYPCVCGLTTLILLWLTNIWEYIFVTLIQMLCSMWLPPASGSLTGAEPHGLAGMYQGRSNPLRIHVCIHTHAFSQKASHILHYKCWNTFLSYCGVNLFQEVLVISFTTITVTAVNKAWKKSTKTLQQSVTNEHYQRVGSHLETIKTFTPKEK